MSLTCHTDVTASFQQQSENAPVWSSTCVTVCQQWFWRQPVHHSEASTWGCENRKTASLHSNISERSRRKWRWRFILCFPRRIHSWQDKEKKEVQIAKIHFPFPQGEEVQQAQEQTLTCPAEQRTSCKNNQHFNTHYCWLLYKLNSYLANGILCWSLLFVQNATMGGFFKCVRELWQGYERGNVEASLPTLDMDGDYISPLSE